MPTYEYECQKCGHHFELFQSMLAKPLTTCPKDLCPKKAWGKGKVTKMLGTGAGLIFKGSGFYITDYRSQNYKEAAKKDANQSTSSTPKSDSKPAASASSSSSESKPKSDTKKPSKS